MPGITEAQKRAFAHQIAEILAANKAVLKQQGLDVTSKLAELQNKLTVAEKAEEAQLQAMAAAKVKTEASVKATKEAYELASAQVEAMVGSLGKKDALSVKVKGIRDSMSKTALRGRKKAAK